MKGKGVRGLAVLIALVVILCLPAVGHADAGFFSGGSDYGGGSYSGGSSYDGGSSSGGGSFNPVMIFVDDEEQAEGIWTSLVLVVAVVIVVIGFVNRKKKGNAAQPAGGAPVARATVDPVVLRAKDPNFSVQAFLEKVSNDYVQMQRCWQEKNWAPMRPLMTDALYSQFDRQLDELRRNGQTNYVERIAVLGCRIVDYRQDETNDLLTVELRTRIVDYTLEDATGKLVSGSRTAEKFMTYEWTLLRSKDMVTPKDDEVRQVHCPNCGAPVAINKSAQCEYCGQVLEVSSYDWVLSAVRGISQQTRGK